VAIASATHAADDVVRVQHGLIVLTGVRRALVGMMQQAGVRTATLHRHLEGPDRQVSIIRRAHGPADDKTREQIQNGGQIQLAAAADHELRRVADPALIECRRRKLAVEQIGRDGLIVIAHRRVLESFARPRLQAVFLHQPHDPLPAHRDLQLEEVLENPRTAIPLPARLKRRAQERRQLERAYADEFSRNGRTLSATTERLLQLKKAVDRQYLSSMELLVRYHASGDRDSIGSCCRTLEHDPILRTFSAFVHYVVNRRANPAAFLASLPRAAQELNDVWALDEIAGFNGEPARWIGFPQPNGLIGVAIRCCFHRRMATWSGEQRVQAVRFTATLVPAVHGSSARQSAGATDLFDGFSDPGSSGETNIRRHDVLQLASSKCALTTRLCLRWRLRERDNLTSNSAPWLRMRISRQDCDSGVLWNGDHRPIR
jgi:hypothetical protein